MLYDNILQTMLLDNDISIIQDAITVYLFVALSKSFSHFVFIPISVLPSVHVKLLSGQFPPWGLIEPRIRGRWHKFLNNDGQLVAMEDNPAEEVVEFCNKSLAFAHWTYKHFEGRAVVCDLQGTVNSHVLYSHVIETLSRMDCSIKS